MNISKKALYMVLLIGSGLIKADGLITQPVVTGASSNSMESLNKFNSMKTMQKMPQVPSIPVQQKIPVEQVMPVEQKMSMQINAEQALQVLEAVNNQQHQISQVIKGALTSIAQIQNKVYRELSEVKTYLMSQGIQQPVSQNVTNEDRHFVQPRRIESESNKMEMIKKKMMDEQLQKQRSVAQIATAPYRG